MSVLVQNLAQLGSSRVRRRKAHRLICSSSAKPGVPGSSSCREQEGKRLRVLFKDRTNSFQGSGGLRDELVASLDQETVCVDRLLPFVCNF